MRARRSCRAAGGALLAAAAACAALGGCSNEPAQPQRTGWLSSLLGKPAEPPAVLIELNARDANAFDEGIALVAEGRHAAAEQRFRTVLPWLEATGDTRRASETLFWLGYCAEKQGRPAAARARYDRLRRDYPSTPAASRAAGRAARLLAPRRAGKGAAPRPRPDAPASTRPAPPPRGTLPRGTRPDTP